ncbi:DUF3095 domain-containing protein [Phyllobacterium lublinensis]|uniref:DUF3095 domain-containing protein n=1 Tax=Phyllobacterium lublinensis TaxID=2875708 RepID=UPI001CCCEBD1|nr:DUF3095 domain-containing protein [Phyllobacterium sp. 2063]MBZ9653626.1 DUF3095 domain-containing protein [Phyllobacterium sp. 2063]
MSMSNNDEFFDTLSVFEEFEGVADMRHYEPLPEDWFLALADIVQSTRAIEEGRYKAVNMAGASVISALLNALCNHTYPFVFGGDGALVALPASAADKARLALAAVQAWVLDVLELRLRAAIVPMTDIRAAGLDVRVARHKVSRDVAYAMFAGGGASWAEAQMKAGKYKVQAAQSGTMPDLHGLSCRWDPIETRNGEIVSIIAMPGRTATNQQFRSLVSEVISIASEQDRSSHPIPSAGPPISFTTRGIAIEARARASRGWGLRHRIAIFGEICVAITLDKMGLRVGAFDPKQYKREVARNSDFRKFEDGLKMTIDLDAGRLNRIETLLENAATTGTCRFGLHRQESALMTCFVPTPLAPGHMHFIDGAAGGYAVAARKLKARFS